MIWTVDRVENWTVDRVENWTGVDRDCVLECCSGIVLNKLGRLVQWQCRCGWR